MAAFAAMGSARVVAAAQRRQFFPAPVEFMLTAALDGTPVGSAVVTVMGRDLMSGRDGRVVVHDGLYPWTPMLVRAPGFVPRATLVRWDRTLALWAAEVPASYLKPVLYGSGGLVKPAGTEVVVVPDQAFADDEACNVALAAAVSLVAHATGTRMHIQRTAPEDKGAVTVSVRVDPGDMYLRSGGTAVFYRKRRGYALGGGDLVLASAKLARNPATLTHELGHLWLWHSDDESDLMSGRGARDEVRGFSKREKQVLRLLASRPAGNRFEDDDQHLGPYADLVSVGLVDHRTIIAPQTPSQIRTASAVAPPGTTVLTCA